VTSAQPLGERISNSAAAASATSLESIATRRRITVAANQVFVERHAA
jgi:hypothetical protein